MLRRLSDGLSHVVYGADGERAGHLRQCGVMISACDRLGNEIGLFDDEDSAIKAILGSAGRPRPSSPARARLAAE
jgi:hypothetical protein